MNYLGDFKVGATVNFNFTTHATAGGAVAPSSPFEAADVLIYKNASATQRSSTNGVVPVSPFDSIVGLHHFSIDLADDSDSGFYAAGNDYAVILSPDETVDSQTVVRVVASFSIENRVVNWAQVVSPSTTLNLSGTTVKTATDVETDTADIQNRIPAALDSGRMSASVGAMGANVLTASALATDAVSEIQSGLSTHSAADVRTELTSELLVMTRLGTGLVQDGAVYQFTTNALENAPGGSGSTVNVMPVSGSATTGNVLDGGRIKGQYGAPLTGLTVTCTTTNAGVTSARDLTAYEGELALVVFENDDEMDYGTRIVNGADITVSSNVATISSTASHVLNTLLGENLRWCLREDKAAPSIVFAIGDYTCQRAPVTVE